MPSMRKLALRYIGTLKAPKRHPSPQLLRRMDPAAFFVAFYQWFMGKSQGKSTIEHLHFFRGKHFVDVLLIHAPISSSFRDIIPSPAKICFTPPSYNDPLVMWFHPLHPPWFLRELNRTGEGICTNHQSMDKNSDNLTPVRPTPIRGPTVHLIRVVHPQIGTKERWSTRNIWSWELY